MPTYSIIDPAWRESFPEALAALEDPRIAQHGDMDRYGAVLTYSHTLTVEQTVAFQQLVVSQAARPVDDVARELDGWNVPNGVYEIQGISETFRYNVHLVTSGDLSGQRVLKRYVEGRYKAFAFITRAGQMKLWRRFASDTNELYVQMAEELLQVVHEVGRSRLFSERSFRFPTRSLTMEFTPRCFHCNATSGVDTYTSVGQWIFEGSCRVTPCQEAHPHHRISTPPVWVDVEAQQQERERIARERRERMEAQRAAMAAEEAQRAAERIARARARILRSEITPSEVR